MYVECQSEIRLSNDRKHAARNWQIHEIYNGVTTENFWNLEVGFSTQRATFGNNSENQFFSSIFHYFVISALKVHQNGALRQCLHCKHFILVHHFGASRKLIGPALRLKIPLLVLRYSVMFS